MSVKGRITLLVGVVVVFSVVIGVTAFLSISRLSQKIDETNVTGVINTRRLAAAQDAIWKLRFGISQYLAVPEPESRKKIIDDSPKWFAVIDENLKLYEAGNLNENTRAGLKKLTEVYSQYKEARPKWFELMEAGKTAEAAEFRSRTILISGAGTVKALDALIDAQTKTCDTLALASKKAANEALLAIGVIALLCIVSTVVIALWIARSITSPVKVLLERLERLQKGDLEVDSSVTSKDEIGTLANGLNETTRTFAGIIRQISETASRVSVSSSQLDATAGRIAGGTGDTVTEISTVAIASNEMMATSDTIAQNCLLAADSSTKASESASSGAVVVKEAITGMERIADQVRVAANAVHSLGSRSEQIGAIVGTIEDIADQTNLLALNAAIEAARAGDQGRGFAVVADEVRALAERTAKATREVGAIIRSIQAETTGAVSAMELGVAEVDRGTLASVKSGEALEMILRQISEVSIQVNQIAIASEEQNATTREITGSIHNINELLQTTSKGSAEIAAEASDLSREAVDLRKLVGQFRLP